MESGEPKPGEPQDTPTEHYENGRLVWKKFTRGDIEYTEHYDAKGVLTERIYADGSKEGFDWDGTTTGRWKGGVSIPLYAPTTPDTAPTGRITPKPLPPEPQKDTAPTGPIAQKTEQELLDEAMNMLEQGYTKPTPSEAEQTQGLAISAPLGINPEVLPPLPPVPPTPNTPPPPVIINIPPTTSHIEDKDEEYEEERPRGFWRSLKKRWIALAAVAGVAVGGWVYDESIKRAHLNPNDKDKITSSAPEKTASKKKDKIETPTKKVETVKKPETAKPKSYEELLKERAKENAKHEKDQFTESVDEKGERMFIRTLPLTDGSEMVTRIFSDGHMETTAAGKRLFPGERKMISPDEAEAFGIKLPEQK
ncbi:hypothetical protein HY311_01010 [Candidatus Nomurabacteria bacterium]|nr:hypothetical protein [Candidatus Nomurabacteria bacterium]